jgi:hypothetical protein
MSLDDANLLEILCTRTNGELRAALECFTIEYKKPLADIIRSKSSYKNYREFVLKILDCEHDEDMKPCDFEVATALANELYAAGGARSLGFDPEPFHRILCNINHVQFESINQVYPKQQLLKDIASKIGGDFQLAVVTRCADKFEYLAGRLNDSLARWSPNNEAICR